MTDADNNNYNLFKNAFDNKSLVVMGVNLVYGVTIAFASLMLLGAIMIAFCDKTNCRYLIYFTCIFFFIIGTLGFFLTIIFSIVAPLTFFGCQFINFSLSSATNFNSKPIIIQVISIKSSLIPALEHTSRLACLAKVEI